ncbi:MAG: hypothetical protein ACE5DW_01275 [Thermodesulfobacteriota bacterium]
MGKYPWLRRRKFFIKRSLQGRFVAGLVILVTCGLFIDLVAAYFLIEGRLTERLYKIHLQVSSTSDIIGPVIWKLATVSVPFIVLAGVALGYMLTRSLEAGLTRQIEAMKMAGQDGDLTVRLAAASSNNLETARGAFNDAMELLDERCAAVQVSAAEIEAAMKELGPAEDIRASELSRAEVIKKLDHMSTKTEFALNKLSIFKV